jgi:subtilase family serine protease
VTIPTGVATGSYYVIARADATAAVAETVETNNTLARAVQIGGDLWVTTMTAPPKAAGGSTIVVTETTVNQGGGAAAASVTKFYLSANGSLDAGDVLLDGTRGVPGLPAGGSSTGSTTVTIPVGTAAGTLYLIAKADGDNQVAETQEANNTRSRSISIGPDLVVYAVAPASVAAGGIMSVTDTVTNQGAGLAAASTTRFYLSKNALLDASDVLLSPGRAVPTVDAATSNTGTTSVTVPAGTAPGAYILLAKTDGDNVVGESLETNNVSARGLQVTPAP